MWNLSLIVKFGCGLLCIWSYVAMWLVISARNSSDSCSIWISVASVLFGNSLYLEFIIVKFQKSISASGDSEKSLEMLATLYSLNYVSLEWK